MSTLGSKIWYGTFHDHSDRTRPHLVPALLWTALLLAVLSVRFLLPFQPTDSDFVHTRIVQALNQGLVWGRQAFVGSLVEFPPLTTLAVLFASYISGVVKVLPGYIVVIVSQTWVFFYILRFPLSNRRRALLALPLLLILATPEMRRLIYSLDPNWMATVPVACGIYHLSRWQLYNSLRDAVLLAINAGLLVFTGPAGICLALVLLAGCSISVRQLLARHGHPELKGVRLLLWTPFLYGTFLIALGNWLIMRDFTFFLHRFQNALLAVDLSGFLALAANAMTPMSWITTGAILVAAVTCLQRESLTAAVLLASLIVLTLCRLLFAGLEMQLPGGDSITIVVAVFTLLHPFNQITRQASGRTHYLRAAGPGLIILITLAFAFLAAGGTTGGTDTPSAVETAPHPGLITSWIDRLWPKARIMVYGIRGPAIYLDHQEQRFVARADFQENTFIQRAHEEQLYLLVPPNNGKFYARERSAMAIIHRFGAPYLLLEKSWPGGWQLWRSVIVPDSELVVGDDD